MGISSAQCRQSRGRDGRFGPPDNVTLPIHCWETINRVFERTSANNMYYAPDLCAEFWRRLTDCNREGTVFSIDKVYDELMYHKDHLSVWSSKNRSMNQHAMNR